VPVGLRRAGARRIEWRALSATGASRRARRRPASASRACCAGDACSAGEQRDGWIGALLPDDPVADTAELPPYPDRTDGVVTLRRWRLSDAPDVRARCR
jgi:hypothetical protein